MISYYADQAAAHEADAENRPDIQSQTTCVLLLAEMYGFDPHHAMQQLQDRQPRFDFRDDGATRVEDTSMSVNRVSGNPTCAKPAASKTGAKRKSKNTATKLPVQNKTTTSKVPCQDIEFDDWEVWA